MATGIDKNSVSGVDPDPTSKPRSYKKRRREESKADAQSQLELSRALTPFLTIAFRSNGTYSHRRQQVIGINDGYIVLDVVEDAVHRNGQDI